MWPFKDKKKEARPLNVGKAIVQITFMDNSSQLREFTGSGSLLGKHLALKFMHECPRNDYRVVSEDNMKVTFKDVRSLELVKIEDFWI